MSKYIVIPIKISLKNNKFAESGDIVDESQLNTNTHDLVSGGFIRLATEEEIESLTKVDVESEEEIDDSETKQELIKKDEIKNKFQKK